MATSLYFVYAYESHSLQLGLNRKVYPVLSQRRGVCISAFYLPHCFPQTIFLFILPNSQTTLIYFVCFLFYCLWSILHNTENAWHTLERTSLSIQRSLTLLKTNEKRFKTYILLTIRLNYFFRLHFTWRVSAVRQSQRTHSLCPLFLYPFHIRCGRAFASL